MANTQEGTKLTLTERLKGVAAPGRFDNIIVSPKFNVTVNHIEDDGSTSVEIDPEPILGNHPDRDELLEPHRITEEPFYVPQDGEVRLFMEAYENNMPVMLKGPTGCGKTRFLEHMAYQLGKPLITVSCQEDMKASDLTGRHLLDANGTYWMDGPLTTGVRHGAIVYLDEVIETREDVKVLLHSLTDHRRQLFLERTHEVLDAHDDFNLVVSFNPHYQSALKKMKPSTRQRFIAMNFDYLPADRETEVVGHEAEVDFATASALVGFGRATRELKGEHLVEGASTRLMTYAGQLVREGLEPRVAARHAIIQPLTDDPGVYNTLEQMADSHFG